MAGESGRKNHIGVFRTAFTIWYGKEPPETLSISGSIPETAVPDGLPGVCQREDI
jgi:hypothetical protein